MALYQSRSNRFQTKHESQLLRRLILTLGLLIALVIIFFLFGIQFLVSISEVVGSTLRKESPVQAKAEPVFPPRLEPLNSATNSATITIQGVGRSGLEVELFQNDKSVKKSAIGSDGLFTFANLNLEPGTNIFTAKQQQTSGETSQSSEPLKITLDKQPPKVDLIEPATNLERKGKEQRELKVIGKTEDGTSLTINDRWVVINQEGAFETTVTLTEGDNTISIIATDAAGNITKITRLVHYSSS